MSVLANEVEFRELCATRGAIPGDIEAAVADVRQFVAFAVGHSGSLAAAGLPALRAYLAALIDTGRNSPERLRALTRYFYVSGATELYVYMTSVLGGREVIPSWAQRTAHLAGETTRQRVFGQDGMEPPPLGTPPEANPPVTARILTALEQALTPSVCRDILAANHHGIPATAFAAEQRVFADSGLGAMLEYRHRTLLAELTEHAASGKPWYEQVITLEVVEVVRHNRAIQAGILCDEAVYVTKIPFAPADYLRETDPVRRRFLACHCPLARSSILARGAGALPVPPVLCYCSGGYEKWPFDVALGRATEVEVLESAMSGSDRCRFRITAPGGWKPSCP